MTQKRLLIFGVVLVMIVTGFNAYVGLTALDRIVSDEGKTCQIQSRGLPAGHELAASMTGIHALLTLPPRPHTPPVPPNVARIIHNLNYHLARYQALEANQPDRRKC